MTRLGPLLLIGYGTALLAAIFLVAAGAAFWIGVLAFWLGGAGLTLFTAWTWWRGRVREARTRSAPARLRWSSSK